MAGFRVHVGVSTTLGVGYGGLAWYMGFSPVQAVLAGGLTALGGMLPDLDADNGRPVREVANGVAAIAPLMVIGPVLRLLHLPSDRETVIAVLIGLYLFFRYGLVELIGLLSVHRGMFHSIPALIIAAEIGFLSYPHASSKVRLLMGVGVAIGFLSHLVLDEIWSVEVSGIRVGLKKSSGTAMKMFGDKFGANAIAYALLLTFSYMTLQAVGMVEPVGTRPSRVANGPLAVPSPTPPR